jgi:RNA polymerase sigma-70 factor, ECF subfamily
MIEGKRERKPVTRGLARLFPARNAADGARASGLDADARLAEAFRRQILPHLDGAYNLACYLTRDAVLSEDVVQDAFLRAHRGFAQFRGESPRAWLFAIVRNCSRSAIGARKTSEIRAVHAGGLSGADAEWVEQLPDGEPGPEQRLIERESAARIREVLGALAEPFREALVLRELEDLSYREIAEVTGVAIGTVMSRLARGRALLAQALVQPDIDASVSRNSA